MNNKLQQLFGGSHYYGDIVRRLFLGGGILMLLTYPSFNEFIPEEPIFNLFAVVFLVLFAGLTNPRQLWVAVADMIISGIAVVIFEFYAIEFYRTAPSQALFIVNQLLALIFLMAFYFSIKTLRGMSFRGA